MAVRKSYLRVPKMDLRSCHLCVQQFGGQISVQSKVDSGSKFKFTFDVDSFATQTP